MSVNAMAENFSVSCVEKLNVDVYSGGDTVGSDCGEGDSEESSKFSMNLLSGTE